MTNDQRFLLECLTTELVSIVMEEEKLSLQEAMHRVMDSDTYQKLQNPKTGLLSQSPLYLYDFLRSNG